MTLSLARDVCDKSQISAEYWWLLDGTLSLMLLSEEVDERCILSSSFYLERFLNPYWLLNHLIQRSPKIDSYVSNSLRINYNDF